MKNTSFTVVMCLMALLVLACAREQAPREFDETDLDEPKSTAKKTEVEVPKQEEQPAATAKEPLEAKEEEPEKAEAKSPPPVEEKDALKLAGEKEVGEAEIVEREGVSLTSIVLGNGMEKVEGKKKPLNPGTMFSAADTEKVIAFMKVVNPNEEETELQVSFQVPESEEELGKVSVTIPAKPKWATRAFYKVKGKKGVWTVIVRHGGEIIAKAPFELTD